MRTRAAPLAPVNYAGRQLDSCAVRRAAEQIHVHRNTSFRWRHRFLALVKTDRPRCLHGSAAHQRAISDEHVCILVARDRTGRIVDFVAGRGQLTRAKLHACLPAVIDRDILLVTDSHPAYPGFAREFGIRHAAVNLYAGIRARCGAYAERACVSQPPAGMAKGVSWRGDTLSAQLPGLALDARREEHHLAGKLAQGHDGKFSTLMVT